MVQGMEKDTTTGTGDTGTQIHIQKLEGKPMIRINHDLLSLVMRAKHVFGYPKPKVAIGIQSTCYPASNIKLHKPS